MRHVLASGLALLASATSAQTICCVDGAPVCCPASLCCGSGCETCHPDNTNMWSPGEQYTCPDGYPVDCGNGRCCPGDFPSCCPQGTCATTSGGCEMKTCPSDHPRQCGNDRCCDAAHPNCCGDSCCDAQHPYCCGDGQCCDAAHPFCCGNGQCAATQSACPSNCPRGYAQASGVNGQVTCCPSGYGFACGDGSCDTAAFCHGAGLLGAAPPKGGGGTGGSGGGGSFTCSPSNAQVTCTAMPACSRCTLSSCGGPDGSACAFYRASDGALFGNTCNASQSCEQAAATSALQHCGCI